MQNRSTPIALATAFSLVAAAASAAYAGENHDGGHQGIQLGPRPFYLVEGMDEGPLKNKLSQCKRGPFSRTDFSIGHRGAALQFPDSDMYKALDTLAKQVKIVGIFSDWPATVTYYANCMGLD